MHELTGKQKRGNVEDRRPKINFNCDKGWYRWPKTGWQADRSSHPIPWTLEGYVWLVIWETSILQLTLRERENPIPQPSLNLELRLSKSMALFSSEGSYGHACLGWPPSCPTYHTEVNRHSGVRDGKSMQSFKKFIPLTFLKERKGPSNKIWTCGEV